MSETTDPLAGYRRELMPGGEPVTWAEIDLSAYQHNLEALKGLCGPDVGMMAVVKADAYGHGAARLVPRAIAAGVDWLGVARLEEGVALREVGVEEPILVLGFSPPEAVETLVEYDLTQALLSFPLAVELSGRAATLGEVLRCHLKIDTGMGRIGLVSHPVGPGSPAGIPVEESLRDALEVARLPGLEVEGVFTHLASADDPTTDDAEQQVDRFGDFLDQLALQGLEFEFRHAANSAAMIRLPKSRFDLVRPGIATYGLVPAAEIDLGEIELRPVLTWKSRIVQLKSVPAGFGVSYGSTYTTTRPTTLATVPVGYADGLSWRLSSRGEMLVAGKRVPIVGRVCMDMVVLDLGSADGVEEGDEVVILGRQGDECLSAEGMAAMLGTINYEIVTSITPRIPRVYAD